MLCSKLCHLLPRFTSLNTTTNHLFFIGNPCLHLSTLKPQNPSPKTFFMVDFLINSCGFSPDQANKASKHLTHLKSPSNPDSVLHFLKQSGFSNTQITEIVSKHPKLLCSKVEKTLRPKFGSFQEMGFSQSDIMELVCGCPFAFRCRDLQEKVEFLRSLSVTNENILRAFKINYSFFSSSLANKIMPNISLLRECGIPDHRIGKMVMNFPWFLSMSSISLRAAIRKTEELGIPRRSGLFCHALKYIAGTNKDTLDDKFKLFESLGWSKVEIVTALGKVPNLFRPSEKTIRDKMDFFVKEAGCKLSYVVRHPVLLGYSLERRLVPRQMVLKILRRKELLRGKQDLLYLTLLSEKNFVEKFVLPHEGKVPGLHEAYVAACSGDKMA